MKRIIYIISFFALLTSVLFITSCSEEITVKPVYCTCNPNFNPDPFSCELPLTIVSCEEKNLKGMQLAPCEDCAFVWFPGAFGCYENDFTEDYGNCVSLPSCVVFGCDLTLLECYGSGHYIGTAKERRTVIDAQEGVHYKINRVSIITDDKVNDFEATDDWYALVELIKILNLADIAEVTISVEYTALTELHSAHLSGRFNYSFGTNHPLTIDKSVGNESDEKTKEKNIQPGTHVIYAIASFDFDDSLTLEGLEDLIFSAKAYEED